MCSRSRIPRSSNNQVPAPQLFAVAKQKFLAGGSRDFPGDAEVAGPHVFDLVQCVSLSNKGLCGNKPAY